MTTYEMIRCKKCSACEISDDGDFICTYDEPTDIHDIPDGECPMDAEFSEDNYV